MSLPDLDIGGYDSSGFGKETIIYSGRLFER